MAASAASSRGDCAAVHPMQPTHLARCAVRCRCPYDVPVCASVPLGIAFDAAVTPDGGGEPPGSYLRGWRRRAARQQGSGTATRPPIMKGRGTVFARVGRRLFRGRRNAGVEDLAPRFTEVLRPR